MKITQELTNEIDDWCFRVVRFSFGKILTPIRRLFVTNVTNRDQNASFETLNFFKTYNGLVVSLFCERTSFTIFLFYVRGKLSEYKKVKKV